jgi:hypothetical protein
MTHSVKAVALVLSLVLCCRAAIATTVNFTFTGAGIHGSVASGAFSIDDAALDPAFYGQISQFAPIFNFSLTVSGIPDGGAASLSFDPAGSSVFFGMDSGGIARIIPGASYTFPGGNFYQLAANTDFYAPPFTPYYHSVLEFVSFSRVQKDDIAWAPAVRATPEPSGAVLLGLGAAMAAVVFLRRQLPRTQN